ncbi:unnamed protein product [Ixodes hexagonus]
MSLLFRSAIKTRSCRSCFHRHRLTPRTIPARSAGDDERNRLSDGTISPELKVFNIFRDEFKGYMKSSGSDTTEPPFPKEVDILVIGGGIMGSSVAYWLKQRAPESFSLAVVERDLTYSRSSTVLSVGGIRQQFSLPENIQLSLFSAQFLRNVKRNLSVLDFDPPNIQFQPHGYLFLASEGGAEQMVKNLDVQEEYGAKVELLRPPELKQQFPWLNTDGIALGSHGLENEGWFDPWSLLTAFRRKAVSLGARYLNAELVDFNFGEVRNTAPDSIDDEYYRPVNHAIVIMSALFLRALFSPLLLTAGTIVNSGYTRGPLRITSLLFSFLLRGPVSIITRQKCLYFPISSPKWPSIIQTAGFYINGAELHGERPDEEPDIGELDVDYSFFDKAIWPSLSNRIQAFESIKMKTAWAGFYDYNTLDQNGIVGRHPYYNNVFFATGFSGHGIQMAPGVGRAIMELILDGRYVSIDLERFGLERLVHRAPLLERAIV